MRTFSSFRWLLLAFLMAGALALPTTVSAQIRVGVSIRVGPPALPVYVQPMCPGPGYIWTPGYWAYGADDYYWVPGTWVLAPQPGFLWTPGYWGWGGGGYLWHAGYWGPHVGFYGGINYGFGYTGVGYGGGYWRGGAFFYNRAVNRVNVTVIHNTFNRTVVNNVTVNRVSYNGGEGGINARPNREEQSAEHERHFAPTNPQMEHERAAGTNRGQFASVNHGRPAFAATPRPGAFNRGANRPNNNERRQERPARNEQQARPQHQNAPRPEARPHQEVKPHQEAKPHPDRGHEPHGGDGHPH